MMLSLARQVLGDVLPPMGGDFPPSTPSPPKYPPGTTCAPDASGVVDHVNCCTVTVPSGGASPFCTDNPSATTDGSSVFLPVGEQCTAACGTEKESSFNLIGACSSGSDVPPSDIPATCESACGAGKTCSQVGELEENECRRMGFSGPETYGNSWKRRCTERTSAALVASPSTPLTCTSNNGGAALMQPGGNAGFECVEEGSQDDDSGGPRLAASVVGGLAAASFAAIAARLR